MYNIPQWVNWHLEPDPGKPKWKKVPGLTYAIDGQDPANWQPFEMVRALDPAHIGFVITANDPYFCIDLDYAWNGTAWSPFALDILARFPGAYTEVSHSGNGLHIIARGAMPPGYGTRGPGIELYSKARFIAITGTHAAGDPDTDHTAALTAVAAMYLKPVSADVPGSVLEWTTQPVPEYTVITDDAEIIRRLLTSKSSAKVAFNGKAGPNDLWNNNIAVLAETWPSNDPSKPYGQSEADAALATHLAFWTGKDCQRIERIMRMSGLVREKWDRRGDDYLKRTIMGSSATAAKVYEGGMPDTDDALNEFLAYLPSHQYVYRPTRQLWPASSVNGSLPWPKNAAGKKTKPSSWLDKRQSIQSMTWHPAHDEVIDGKVVNDGGWRDHTGSRTYNLYLAPTVILGDAKAAKPWTDRVGRIYPGEVGNHILNWCAHRVQRPGEKINHALVLGGPQGIGKDSLLEPVKHAVGPWNFKEIGPPQLLGRFNPHIRAVILRISEARDLGEMNRFEFYEHTKPLFAAPPDVLLCDEKNTKEHYVFNVLGAIITTNYLTGGLYLPPDDRRHYVAWSNTTREEFDDNYWSEYWAWLDDGGIGHVAAYLAGLDLSSFDPKAPPAKTDAWNQIVSAGIAPEESDLADLILAMGNPAILTFDMLRSAAPTFGFTNIITDIGNPQRQKAMVHRLERVGYDLVPNPDEKSGRWSSGGRKVRVYGRKEYTVSELLGMAGMAALAGFPITPTTLPVPSQIT